MKTLSPALLLIAGALGATAALPSLAAEGPPARGATLLKPVEQALEVSAAQITIPGGGVGLITVTPCAGCQPVSVLMGSRSQLLVNGTAVAVNELRRVLAANPEAPAVLLYRSGGNELTRLLVSAPVAPKAGANPNTSQGGRPQ